MKRLRSQSFLYLYGVGITLTIAKGQLYGFVVGTGDQHGEAARPSLRWPHSSGDSLGTC